MTCRDTIQPGDLVETPDGYRWVVMAVQGSEPIFRFRGSDPFPLIGAVLVSDWWSDDCNAIGDVCAPTHGGEGCLN